LTGICDPGHRHGEGDACPWGVFIPCSQFGKTRYRLARLDRHQDPFELHDDDNDGYHACNSACCQWAALCTFLPCEYMNEIAVPGRELIRTLVCGWGVFTANETRRVREKYNIEGDFGNDLANGLFCPCCSIIRNELEIRRRENAHELGYVPPAGFVEDQYHSPPPMTTLLEPLPVQRNGEALHCYLRE
jgi:Cys-rich protein (TIGR01571 family)